MWQGLSNRTFFQAEIFKLNKNYVSNFIIEFNYFKLLFNLIIIPFYKNYVQIKLRHLICYSSSILEIPVSIYI